MSVSVGADVEALCAKCGDVWHVVVAKVGAQIAKVQCKQCGGYHRYKSPHNAPAEAKLPSTTRPPKAPRAKAEPVARVEKSTVEADLSKPAKTYRASELFEVTERVDHPTFGQGIVEVSEPGKVTIFFATGRRVLVQSKTGGAPSNNLERPKPFDYTIVTGGKPIPNQ